MKKIILVQFTLLSFFIASAKKGYWQQQANYSIAIQLNTSNHNFSGTSRIEYFNNSGESLTELYFHLYNNAFQPNSEMDVLCRTIPDPDWRVGNRISTLTAEEQGHLHVSEIKVNGLNCTFLENETILQVKLNSPIGSEKVVIELAFNGQVPLQIRRSGRSNSEGIEYSMSQWYPKLCEYDADGWHPNPYVGREFYGIWGNFDVAITLPANYVVAAGGIHENSQECVVLKENSKKLNTWKFKAENVHDFVWTADKDYEILREQVPNGPLLQFYYQGNQKYSETWKNSTRLLVQAFEFLSAHYGKYPYPVYNFIQGGDGGMEYPMATLITGNRSLPSLVGVCVHEGAHSWFQGLLGTNESLYAWMDEGFTSYAATEVMNRLFPANADLTHNDAATSYIGLAISGNEEPLTTHADHFNSNYAYGVAAYNKGETYLHQIKTIVGDDVFDKLMLSYFNEWSFKHPSSADFIRIAEKESGMILDWYDEYFVKTTKTIDYAVEAVVNTKNSAEIKLKRIGQMPMPCELTVEFKGGKKCTYYIPFDLTRGVKNNGNLKQDWKVAKPWRWCDQTYTLTLSTTNQVEKVTIDESKGTADIDRLNNTFIVK